VSNVLKVGEAQIMRLDGQGPRIPPPQLAPQLSMVPLDRSRRAWRAAA